MQMSNKKLFNLEKKALQAQIKADLIRDELALALSEFTGFTIHPEPYGEGFAYVIDKTENRDVINDECYSITELLEHTKKLKERSNYFKNKE